jgi:hypothetical protein
MRRADRTVNELADRLTIRNSNWFTRSSGDPRKDWHELFAYRTSSWEAPGFSLHPPLAHSCTVPFFDACWLVRP